MGSKAILVADDMELVRNLCKLALETAGYRVIAAPDGLSAVVLYREHADSIELSLIDFRMPGLPGIQVARTIRAIDPGAKIALMTGDNSPGAVPDDLCDGSAILEKPFTIAGLRAVVKQLLGSQQEKSSSAAAGAHQTSPTSTLYERGLTK
jgi:DNA-binding NtrC family response regulator